MSSNLNVAPPRETSSCSGNKIHCFPRDRSVSVILENQANYKLTRACNTLINIFTVKMFVGSLFLPNSMAGM